MTVTTAAGTDASFRTSWSGAYPKDLPTRHAESSQRSLSSGMPNHHGRLGMRQSDKVSLLILMVLLARITRAVLPVVKVIRGISVETHFETSEKEFEGNTTLLKSLKNQNDNQKPNKSKQEYLTLSASNPGRYKRH